MVTPWVYYCSYVSVNKYNIYIYVYICIHVYTCVYMCIHSAVLKPRNPGHSEGLLIWRAAHVHLIEQRLLPTQHSEKKKKNIYIYIYIYLKNWGLMLKRPHPHPPMARPSVQPETQTLKPSICTEILKP